MRVKREPPLPLPLTTPLIAANWSPAVRLLLFVLDRHKICSPFADLFSFCVCVCVQKHQCLLQYSSRVWRSHANLMHCQIVGWPEGPALTIWVLIQVHNASEAPACVTWLAYISMHALHITPVNFRICAERMSQGS